MNSPTVIITGAHGFIGRHAAMSFAEKDWRVVGLDCNVSQEFKPSHWGITEWHIAEVTTGNLVSLGIRPTALVHCAGSGSVGFSYSDPVIDFHCSVITTLHALEFIRSFSPGTVFVLPSSAAVYGLAQVLPTPTNHPLDPASPYGTHKIAAELLCRSYQRNFGVGSVIIRLFSVFGEGQRKLLLWDVCNKINTGQHEFFGTGNETRDFLYVGDAAELLRYAAECGQCGQITVANGGTGQAVSIREVLIEVFRLFGVNKKPLFNGKIKDGDPMHYQADITEARKWGWYPKVERYDGFRRYVEWWRKIVNEGVQ